MGSTVWRIEWTCVTDGHEPGQVTSEFATWAAESYVQGLHEDEPAQAYLVTATDPQGNAFTIKVDRTSGLDSYDVTDIKVRS